MGPTTLSEYVEIFDLSILVETFFNKPTYTVEELNTVEKFIKGFIHDFCHCVDHQEKEGMKLIKIHLLVHFVECTWMYGSPMNFNGSTGDSHLKSKTKQPAQRTRMHDVDVEYMTAMKDYENIVLERGLAEIESYQKKAAPAEPVKPHLGRQYHSFQNKDGKSVYARSMESIIKISLQIGRVSTLLMIT